MKRDAITRSGSPDSNNGRPGRKWFGRALVGCNLAIACVFAAAFLARYVHPEHAWILQLFALFLPVATVGSFAFLILTAVLGTRRLVALNLALILLAGLRMLPFERIGSQQSGPGSPEVFVLSFNSGNQTSTDGETISDVILGDPPDIVALQEAPLVFTEGNTGFIDERTIRPLLDRYGTHEPDSRLDPDEAGDPRHSKTLLPILSDLEFVRFEKLPIRPIRRGGRPDAVTITRAEFSLGDRSIAVYNVHLLSFGAGPRSPGVPISRRSLRFWWDKLNSFAEDSRIRAVEAEAVRALLDAETLPFIVCGDLNSTPDTWVYRHLASGLQDAFRKAGGLWGGTFYADYPALRIDYILASPEWHVRSAGARYTTFSDHRPVTARMALPPGNNASRTE